MNTLLKNLSFFVLSSLIVMPPAVGMPDFPELYRPLQAGEEPVYQRTRLDIRNYQLASEDESIIKEALHHNQSQIQDVFLEGIKSGISSLQEVIQSFNPAKLTNITFRKFEDFPMETFFEFLKGNTVLRCLSLEDMKLDEDNLRNLSTILKDLPALETLSLSGNNIGANLPLLTTLFESRTLRDLDLEKNNINGEGGSTVANILTEKKPTSLVSLRIGENLIDQDGIINLNNAVEEINNSRTTGLIPLTLYGSKVQGPINISLKIIHLEGRPGVDVLSVISEEEVSF